MDSRRVLNLASLLIKQFLLVFYEILSFLFFEFNQILEVMNAVGIVVEIVVDGDCHFAAGIVTAARTVNLTRFFRCFEHRIENTVDFDFGRDFVCTEIRTVGVFSYIIVKIQVGKLFVQCRKAFLRSRISRPCAL